MNRMYRRLLAIPVLLLALSGSLAAQREAFTLLRLGRICDAAGLFRLEGAATDADGISSLRMTCLRPIKGVARDEVVRAANMACPCCQCLVRDLSSLPPGTVLLLFLARGEDDLFRQLPGGALPGNEGLASAAEALLEATSPEDVARLLAAQLGHEQARVQEDAVLSLFALPSPLLAQVAAQARPRLAIYLQDLCRSPGPFTTWGVRLAGRLEMREAVPEVVELLLRENLPGAREFLVGQVLSLDPAAALQMLSKVPTSEPTRALAVAALLHDLALPEGADDLARLAQHPQPAVRKIALTALAEVAPERPILSQALKADPSLTAPLARALLGSPHPAAAAVLQQAEKEDPKLTRVVRQERARAVKAPTFRALFPKRQVR